ncbi:hypothetical protein H8R03_29715 [Streptomyces sp. JH010]|uniref:hypothetical protein n=1 Tax=Streptomyces sp. JH010 TaxID=2763535 RepID=UPI0023F87DE8|nr:hypothetical protein [Streptomyces sp. JH010]MDF6066103.1 hypothetical protein [Streptomyces sp. JH010]
MDEQFLDAASSHELEEIPQSVDQRLVEHNGSYYQVRQAELAGDVHFPPVRNGLDYLVSVAEHLEGGREPSARAMKYAVLHLAAGAEVLLKARLQMVHWSLVFANPGDATREALENGTLNSCSPEETRKRLTNMAGIKFSQSEKDALSNLAKRRNALQHYGLVGENAKAGKVESTTAQVLNFLISFVGEHILEHITDEEERRHAEIDMDRIRGGVRTIQGYVAERMKDLGPVLGPVRARTLQCPQCRQFALTPTMIKGVPEWCQSDASLSPLYCHLCVEGYGALGLALGYAVHVLDRAAPDASYDGDAPNRCPVCAMSSLVRGARTAAAPETPIDFCFHCADVVDGLQECQRCGFIYTTEQGHRCRLGN